MHRIRKWLAMVGALMGPLAMGLSFSLINTNLESIHQEFNATLTQLQWIINIYGIFIASSLVIMGRLGDVIGRKNLYVIGIFAFGIAMLGAGLAVTPNMIIGFQILYGLAGAILLPMSQALLIDIYPENKKGIAVGLWTAAGGFALALGPVIGGITLSFLDWRWIFFINVPFSIFGIFLVSIFAKESKTENESKKIDWLGGFLLFLTIGTFILATIQSHLWKPSLIIAIYSVTLISLILLLVVENKIKMPIIREDLFKNRTFLFCSVSGFCMIAMFWAAIFLIPLYIQKVLDYSPLDAGLMMLTLSLPVGVLSPVSGYLYDKLGPKILMFLGFALLIISTFMQLQYHVGISTWFIFFTTLILGIGITLIWSPSTTGALYAISRNFGGIASGTFVTIQEIGGNVGLAVTATVARSQETFSLGFHEGTWVMLLISLVGLLSTLFLPRRSIQKGHS